MILVASENGREEAEASSVETVGVGAERAESDLDTSVQPKELARRELGSSSLLPRRQFLL